MITEQLEYYIECITNKETIALKNIYEIMGQAVFSYAYTISRDRQLAEDIAQDVFIKILSSADSYKKGKNPKAWIMSITHNVAVDTLRKRKNIAISDITEPVFSELSIDGFEESITNEINIERYLSRLDSVQQEIIKLHLLTELSFREIAQILNMTLGKVGWQYKRAIAQLQQLMKDEVIR
ncbi:MAG: polymerase sigma factor, sigma-70 family [Herbinix sp.]|nr:polymerase sigma factor, sigma-70 family [Herbinix sp.]